MNANTFPFGFSATRFSARVALLIAVAAPSVFAGERDQISAFTALQFVEDRFGPAAADSIVELRGHRGQSQPEIWRVIAFDRASPYLLSEFKVDRKRAVDEGPYSDFYPDYVPDGFVKRSKIQVDSTGAFRVLVTEASRAGVGFDSASYHLRCREFSEEPLWRLTALDVDGYTVGRVDLSAATGTVLRTVWYFWEENRRNAPRIVDSALLGGPGFPRETESTRVGQVSVGDGAIVVPTTPEPEPAPAPPSNLRPFQPRPTAPTGPPVAEVEPLNPIPGTPAGTATPAPPASAPAPTPPTTVEREMPAVPPAPAPTPAPAPAPAAAESESDLPLPPPLPPSLEKNRPGGNSTPAPSTIRPTADPKPAPPRRVVNHPEGDPVEVTPIPADSE